MAIHYFTIPTRASQSNNNQSNNRHDKRHRYRFNIQPVKYLLVLLIGVNGLTSQKANASDVGGVSATANPVANSSGSVTPYEAYYDDPVYDTSTDADGNLANPGNVLYTMPTRTGQKQNSNVSLGLSATLSIPLDRRLHKGCIRAANTQTDLQQQILANKRLDFEMARLIPSHLTHLSVPILLCKM